MRTFFWLVLLLLSCGPASGPDAGTPDAGPEPEEQVTPWRELPEETLSVACRPIVGARFHSVDPDAPQHFRAERSNVLLRSDDEGHTWTRATIDPSLYALMAGPVVVAYANVDPLFARSQWSASNDRGATWQALTMTLLTDAALPAGTVGGTVGTTRVAWTPTGRLHYSLDDGATWRSEPDVAHPTGVSSEWHATLGEREWLAQSRERTLYASSDRGRTWVKKPWHDFQSVRLVGEAGLVAGGFTGDLWVSRDDGLHWRKPDGLSGAVSVGPADGELWVTNKADDRLMHSLDWGDSFAPVRVSLGADGATATARPVNARVFTLADGRKVFAFELPGVPTLPFSSVVCTQTSGAGALLQPSPSRTTGPGTASLWAQARVGGGQALGSLQQVVPLAEPGQAYWLGQQTFADTVSINGGTRTPSGSVAVLLQPAPVILRNTGPPMRVQELEPVGLTPTVVTRFDNLLELGTGSVAKYLASTTLQALPDGTFRTDTGEGDYPLGGATAMWAPWPSDGRWGTLLGGVAMVTKDFVGATQFLRLSRDLLEAPVFCEAATSPNARCLVYPGHVRDFAHREGKLYVLDDWRGEVLQADFLTPTAPWTPVLVGLAQPTSLFLPLDADPGVYVVDTHLYRFLPAAGTPARRP